MDFDERNIQPLGHPLPFANPHAVSVSMPRWQDVVSYEEGEQQTLEAMSCGYPRFFLHPFYERLRKTFDHEARSDEAVWVFPSLAVAAECIHFVGAGRVQKASDGVALAFIPLDKQTKAKEFWQHAGLIISSRQAENFILGRKPSSSDVYTKLKKMIAGFNAVADSDVYLSCTGMGAVFCAYKALDLGYGSKAIQLGFPYLDTLKILEKFGEGIYVPYNSSDDLDILKRHIEDGAVAAVFCEIPGNPLLRTIDLRRLKDILEPQGIPLIIDDTLGTPFNIDIAHYADITVTSLTKFFSGAGNVMGGSLILNRSSPHYTSFKARMDDCEELLYADDADVLLKNGQGFSARMQTINQNALKLVHYLRNHPAIGCVYYPKGDPVYEAIRKPAGGYGGLLSFTLKDPEKAPFVYGALRIAKGPSLGTDFTLACPFVLLAHYNELDWTQKNGVTPDLIRVSVGRENSDEIIRRFGEALGEALGHERVAM